MLLSDIKYSTKLGTCQELFVPNSEMDFYMNFWNSFENILDSRNYNPSSLAKIIGIPKTTIYGWQNGASPALDKLIPIADFLEISLDELEIGRASCRERV